MAETSVYEEGRGPAGDPVEAHKQSELGWSFASNPIESVPDDRPLVQDRGNWYSETTESKAFVIFE